MAYKGGNNQARRNRLAYARGFRGLRYSAALGAWVQSSPSGVRGAFNTYRLTIAGRRAPRPARVQFGDGIEHVYTRDEGSLRSAILRAERNDLRLYPIVTVLLDPEDGSHPRTWPPHQIELWGKGGYDAGAAAALMRAGPDGFAFGMIADQIAELAANAQGISAANGVVLEVLLRVDESQP